MLGGVAACCVLCGLGVVGITGFVYVVRCLALLQLEQFPRVHNNIIMTCAVLVVVGSGMTRVCCAVDSYATLLMKSTSIAVHLHERGQRFSGQVCGQQCLRPGHDFEVVLLDHVHGQYPVGLRAMRAPKSQTAYSERRTGSAGSADERRTLRVFLPLNASAE